MPTASHYSQANTSLHRIRHCYFIHEGAAYSVEFAPVDVFKAAINACIDQKQLADRNILQEATSVLDGPDDIYSRWWLVSYIALRSTDNPMTLYATQSQAERACDEPTAKTR